MTHRPSIAALLLGAQAVTACTSWKVQAVRPQELVANEHPKAIQVWERDGAKYVIHAPRVERDSLMGTGTVKRVEGVPIAISMKMVDSIAVRRHNVLKSVVAFVLIPLAAFIASVGAGANARYYNAR